MGSPDSTAPRVVPRIVSAVAWVFVIALWPARLWPWHGISLVALVLLTVRLRLAPATLLRRMAAMLPFAALVAVGQLIQPDWPLRVANLLLKAILCLWVMNLILASLPFPCLLRGLRSLGVPVLITELLGFWDRYLHVLRDEWERMRLARIARTFHPSRTGEFAILTQSLGLLLVRSYERAERIHQARLSRGYRGGQP